MECYKFYQQCKDHFNTARATGPNGILFAASFLRRTISRRWVQHKIRHQSTSLITWPEFKKFFWRNLGNSRAFVDGLWSNIKRDSQYQGEFALDWVSHLEYLQSILQEFDPAVAPGELTIIQYFWENLKPFIRAEIKQCGREWDSFEELVKKAKDAKSKAALRPRSMSDRLISIAFEAIGLNLKRPRVKPAWKTQGLKNQDLDFKKLSQ